MSDAIQFRMISSNTCPKCKHFHKSLTYYKIGFTVYDADDPKNEKQLDKWNIDDMPVMQIIDTRKSLGEDVVFQFGVGEVGIRSLKFKIDQIKRNNK